MYINNQQIVLVGTEKSENQLKEGETEAILPLNKFEKFV